VATWLIEPLRAPEFSLPDLTGATRELKQFRGGLVLLNFWATTAPLSSEQLKVLHRHQAALVSRQMQVVAVNVDDAGDVSKARSFATREGLAFPVLFATEELAGIYNIIYRYLFDRRRDLAIPTSFLVDREGMIVKVYQGPVEVDGLLADARSMPVTAAERVRKALPFTGTLYQSAFQRNDFTYGVAMFQHGYLDEAAASFQQVVAAKPDDAEGYYNLGTLSLQRHDFPQARRYLEQTLKLRPNYPEAWNNLGMMAAQEGNAAEAVQNFQQSLLLRPGYATALLNLGNVYRRQGDFAKAQECLTHALDIQPNDPETNYSLGMFYAQQNQLSRAADFLQKAAELRPDYPEALNNLGVLYVREQEYAKAEGQFKSCIRVNPKFDQAYLNLARLYVMQNDKERARAVLQDLLRALPESATGKQAMDVLNSLP
jgi:tetratricopeptide (TPR) repeat protein